MKSTAHSATLATHVLRTARALRRISINIASMKNDSSDPRLLWALVTVLIPENYYLYPLYTGTLFAGNVFSL